MINGLHGEVERHELYDRTQATKGCPDTDPCKAMLCDRGIDDAFRAELFKHALGNFVSALVFGDFLPHEKHCLVTAHLFGHAFAQRFTNGLLLDFGAFGPVGCQVGHWGGVWRCGFGRDGGCSGCRC